MSKRELFLLVITHWDERTHIIKVGTAAIAKSFLPRLQKNLSNNGRDIGITSELHRGTYASAQYTLEILYRKMKAEQDKHLEQAEVIASG